MKQKRILTILYRFAFLICSASTFYSCLGPQAVTKNGTPVPYKVNCIVIHKQPDKQTAYEAIANHLLANGYSLSYSDSKLLTLRTEFRNIPKKGMDASTDVSLTAFVYEKDGDVMIRLTGIGKQHLAPSKAVDLGEFTISHMGQSGSLTRMAWNELYRIASTFSDNLTFETL